MTKVTVRRGTRLTHTVTMREHQLTTDEPRELGGEDDGPTPQELLAASLAGTSGLSRSAASSLPLSEARSPSSRSSCAYRPR